MMERNNETVKEDKMIPARIIAPDTNQSERMLKWFTYNHLPHPLWQVLQPFRDFAMHLCSILPAGPERTVALRKLLEAKDAAVRAKLNPEG